MTFPPNFAEQGSLFFGADYNPEQWPEEVWPQDIALMQDAGINLVTVGVFSWAQLEPEEGRWNFGWLDRILDLLHDGGIRVDLATPTASPPPWLGHRYPGSLPQDADGRTLWYGSRNQFNPSSSAYRRAAASVTEALARRYGSHPAVAMWHVGNELGQVSFDDETAHAFRGWLQKRHGSLEELNAAWGTAFWSQRYSSWEEILPPRRAPYIGNPAQALDFKRFTSDELLSLYRLQRDIIRRHDPEKPVTTNLMGFFPGADYFSLAPETDVVANDWYTDPADPGSRELGALTHDLCRGLGSGRPWLLLESATSAVNWRSHNVPKAPGALRIDALSAVARGADGICFFQFRQSAAGAERFHSAVVPLAGADTRVYRETAALGKSLRALAPVTGTGVPASVAILFDWDSWWAAEESARPSERLRVMDQMLSFYRPLLRHGIAVEVVHPGSDLSRFALVLAPNLFLLRAAHAEALEEYAAAGGAFLAGPFTGVADENARLATGRFPALLRRCLGVSGEEWVPLAKPAAVAFASPAAPAGTAYFWAEDLRLDGARALACFSSGPLAGKPALTHHPYGSGQAWYVGADLDDAALSAVVMDAVAAAGITSVFSGGLPDDVEAVHRGQWLFLLNHGGVRRSVRAPAAGTDLLTGHRAGPDLELEPYGAVVLELSGSARNNVNDETIRTTHEIH
ncbi:beta-galactosidase [Arthrobacter sp. ATA002]|uniref:beta-galactosidase n=1 Tax=Arthrobacter sp. ATA002 TaxID=2991715 RepID=UPI0022A7B121|nr:beta-galactosidase [Arthrobacter sp. ATA002]WAP52988.1 beta-galactosidase [Arthrobacter sp. ATA002]